MASKKTNSTPKAPPLDRASILADYRLACLSRQASLLGRKEVLSGKAKFGIFGDGKELAQIALARSFAPGDWRSGYYRDQTLMLALGVISLQEFFAQLYAETDLKAEPQSGGRQMNCHFATRFIQEDGSWAKQTNSKNSSADASPTGAQMGRLLGLGYASKLYRQLPSSDKEERFSRNGREVAFGTIGNASTSEGLFWETLNAAGVLQVPVVISVWDDGYGISVPNQYQTTKESISKVCAGFTRDIDSPGFEIAVVPGWDYPALVATYQRVTELARDAHIPALVHVTELAQPQGHSTSGSHERYKSSERLAYEDSIDCLRRMRDWILSSELSTESELLLLEEEARAEVLAARDAAWTAYLQPIQDEKKKLLALLAPHQDLQDLYRQLDRSPQLSRKVILASARRALYRLKNRDAILQTFVRQYSAENQLRYNSKLYNEGPSSALLINTKAASYSSQPESVDGRHIIQRCFDAHLSRDPRVFIIGEDVGKLGGVNLEFDGLSDTHGEHRVTDTGIREATILGQGLGAALRGLRPIVDIQYLDYLLYCFQLLSDDLASLHYRTAGGQLAPVIIRTKGHRLEGIWHSGSPMGMILNGLRGIHVCVPRNMVQAAGLYNTLLAADDPALVIEVLSGYRIKENVPENLSTFRLALGEPEILHQAPDAGLTIVSYGACLAIIREALPLLAELGIGVELIDVQTLLPFDRTATIKSSLKRTHALLIVDEDVPGGASAFILQQVLEGQAGYEELDAPPRTLTAKAHRSPYGTDGDYFTKPSIEDVVELVYSMMREREPLRFGDLGLTEPISG